MLRDVNTFPKYLFSIFDLTLFQALKNITAKRLIADNIMMRNNVLFNHALGLALGIGSNLDAGTICKVTLQLKTEEIT